jgi:hypothetical protein
VLAKAAPAPSSLALSLSALSLGRKVTRNAS